MSTPPPSEKKAVQGNCPLSSRHRGLHEGVELNYIVVSVKKLNYVAEDIRAGHS